MSLQAHQIYLDENNNEVEIVPNERRRSLQISLRKIIMLMGSLCLVGAIGFIGTGAHARGVDTSNLQQIAPSAKGMTLDEIRTLAQEVGSIPPSNLAELEKAEEICYTPGCMEAALSLLNSINFTVNPCQDFFQFSCGRWLQNNLIPPAFSRWSQFNHLRDEVNNITQGILTAPKDQGDARPINQVKDLYTTCLDTDALEVAGLTSLRDILKSFGDWPLLVPDTWDGTEFDWIKTIAQVRRRFLDTVLFNVYVDQDLKSADNNIVFVDQPSLVLPRDMLINDGGQFNVQIAAYRQFVKDVAFELARADPDTPLPDDGILELAVNEMIELEREIAAATTRDQDRTDYDRMYNKFALNAYQLIIDPLMPSLKLKPMLDEVFSTSGVTIATTEPIIVLETGYVEKLTEILERAAPPTLSNYILFRIVNGLGVETTKAMRDSAFKFNQVLTGAREPPTRQMTCADGANAGLGMAIGVKYVEQKFDENAKTEVNQLVEDLRVSFKKLLETADWMDATTKVKAEVKADGMKKFMAYPDWLSDKAEVEKYFQGLEITEGDHFGNAEKVAHWSGDKSLKTLRNPVDRNLWLSYPGIVNAFYAPTYNSITFPAGILQAPFFKSGYPSFLNYGGIGVVIGHEITHGFDNSGRQFDEKGNAENWWSDGTAANYEVKAKCIENQYGDYKVDVEGVEMSVDGLLTLGENIADNGGVRQAYLAYQKFVQDMEWRKDCLVWNNLTLNSFSTSAMLIYGVRI